jgi:cytoskeletal protein CcmA (bactofilin family)
MWKKDDVKPQGTPEKLTSTPANPPAFGSAPANPPHVVVAHTPAPAPAPVAPTAAPVAQAAPSFSAPRSGAVIGQGIKIKGEVHGSEDLFVDGLVDGQLTLTNGNLTIGPNGTVKADVVAKEVVVRGRIDGKVSGRDKVQLMSSSQVVGEVVTERLAIEEGALLRGKVEAGKLAATPKAAEARPAAPAVPPPASTPNVEVLPPASEPAAD